MSSTSITEHDQYVNTDMRIEHIMDLIKKALTVRQNYTEASIRGHKTTIDRCIENELLYLDAIRDRITKVAK